jgi:hypothetical protein
MTMSTEMCVEEAMAYKTYEELKKEIETVWAYGQKEALAYLESFKHKCKDYGK